MSVRILIPAIMVLMLGTSGTGMAYIAYQDDMVSPDFSFICVQNDKEFILKSRLSYWNGQRDVPISGAELVFYNMAGEEHRRLETLATNMNGEAEFRVPKDSGELISVENTYAFRSVFAGNQQYESTEDMVELRPLNIRIEFVEIDSVKTIQAEAFELDPGGMPIPLDATDVYFFSPRSFSLLPIGEGWFEEGKAQLEFPTSLPGDSIGNLTIVAKIEDHELYGNVEAIAVKDWGLARPPVLVNKRRGLGDTDAPLWMVYTLIVLLSIVWFHYLYVFYLMIKIKKLRRNQEVNYDTSDG